MSAAFSPSGTVTSGVARALSRAPAVHALSLPGTPCHQRPAVGTEPGADSRGNDGTLPPRPQPVAPAPLAAGEHLSSFGVAWGLQDALLHAAPPQSIRRGPPSASGRDAPLSPARPRNVARPLLPGAGAAPSCSLACGGSRDSAVLGGARWVAGCAGFPATCEVTRATCAWYEQGEPCSRVSPVYAE